MLDKIKKQLSMKYNINQNLSVFLSLYDKKWKLLWSKWIIESDKNAWEILETLYNLIKVESDNVIAILDILSEIKEISKKEDILSIDLKKQSLLVRWENNNSGIVLAGTSWIDNIKDALKDIKKKHKISGKAKIYSINTDRIIISN